MARPLLARPQPDGLQLGGLAKIWSFSSDPSPLGKGQTTEILEMRRNPSAELALFEKIVDSVRPGTEKAVGAKGKKSGARVDNA